MHMADNIIDDLRGLQGDKLSPDAKRQLKSYLTAPSTRKWSDINGLHVKGYRTAWQLVLEVDPTFPKTGPRHDIETDRLLKDWERIPSRELLLEALRKATQGQREPKV
jgi:hypothetical protein